MTLREIVARNLRDLRRAKGLSQEELAHRAELNRNYVGMLERCENSATVDVLERLAHVLAIDPTMFMDRSFLVADSHVSAMALPDRLEPLVQDASPEHTIHDGATAMTGKPFLDCPPSGDLLTPYDLEQSQRYLRLLDAATDPTATWQEAVTLIFGVDTAREPERARRIHDTHLARARWMTEVGYRQLLSLDRFGV